MTAEWILNWYNLLFIVPFALALAYLGLYTLSGWTFGEADADAPVDHDLDHDVDVSGADHHLDIGGGADHAVDLGLDHHHDAAHGHGNGGVWLAVLSWLGLGRVPLSILLMILLLTWGVVGFAANSYLRGNQPQVARPWLVSIPLAAIGALLMTRVMSGLFARYLPTSETYARRRHELLGRSGVVVLPVDRSFGMVAVRDASGDLFQLPCRLEAGQRTIEKGALVTLVAYNAQERLFYVLESGEGNSPSRVEVTRGSSARATEQSP